MNNNKEDRSIIAWFTYNPVASNLLMVAILICGLISALNIKSTLNPDIVPNLVDITVPYPGAAPAEVEQGVTIKVEESIKDVEGVTHIASRSEESVSITTVEISNSYDILAVIDTIQSRVEAINNFPKQIEKPLIAQQQKRHQAIIVQIHGDMNERDMTAFANSLKNEMIQDPDISAVDVLGARPYEISIEIPEYTLRKYKLSISSVVRSIQESSQNIPGGKIKTANGNIILRSRGQAYNQYDYENVVLKVYENNESLTLGDIATIKDGFSESEDFARFDGKPSIALSVYSLGNQDIIKIAEKVQDFVDGKQSSLPSNVKLDTWANVTYYLEDRIDMMTINMLIGAVLVFVILALFLDIRIAFWVMAGLPVSFLGAFAVMHLHPFNVSLNMISLFGFLLILGIVVDDAIIISESISTELENGKQTVEKVILGVKRVAVPATFGVLTTIVAFMPTIFTSGSMSAMPEAIGYVVIFCLCFSLIESKLILPAHLGQSVRSRQKSETRDFLSDSYDVEEDTLIDDGWVYDAQSERKHRWFHNTLQCFDSIKKKVDGVLKDFIRYQYQPFIIAALKRRYLVLSLFVALLILTIGLFSSGVIRYVMMPDVPSDYLVVKLDMLDGASDEQMRLAMTTVEEALDKIETEYRYESGINEGFILHQLVMGRNGNSGFYMVELIKNTDREIDSFEIIESWRQTTGALAGVKNLTFSSAEDAGGPPLSFKVISSSSEQRIAAAALLEKQLETYHGVFGVENSSGESVEELHLKIKNSAKSLGLSLHDLGSQVRQAFYGAEVQRIQRNKDDVKVVVRYPEEERSSIDSLENMYISSAEGTEIPFAAVADVELKIGQSKITRINGEPAAIVTARIDKALVEPSKISNDILNRFANDLKERYPSVKIQLDGLSKESQKMLKNIFTGFWLSLLGIYVLLAIPLRSYSQPLVIMVVIPFGIIGAAIGHLIMGAAVNILSLFGIIALTGVVVNDSLVLVDFINRSLALGLSVEQATIRAVTQRFRAVFITSLTTFFGLVPILFETSMQAQFVIPMAISLSFGILFTTVITLILVPVLYLILEDFSKWFASNKRNVLKQFGGFERE